MSLGPIEILVIGFRGNEFNGEIIPELQRLIENDIITIIDGLLVRKDGDGDLTFVEFSEIDSNDDAAQLAGVLQQWDALISDEDVAELAASLAPDSSGAIMIFEHTWGKGLRDAIVDSGGSLLGNVRVPGLVVDQLLAELAALD